MRNEEDDDARSCQRLAPFESVGTMADFERRACTSEWAGTPVGNSPDTLSPWAITRMHLEPGAYDGTRHGEGGRPNVWLFWRIHPLGRRVSDYLRPVHAVGSVWNGHHHTGGLRYGPTLPA
ncbi:hypothetical protein GCM10025857_33090 [Alicyclobacillus contaminans]|nr:hypothetical protein GCM10025857_33090 [Alicyclobacillus contaminans]